MERHTFSAAWAENRFGEADMRSPHDMTQCENLSNPSCSYPLPAPTQQECAPSNMHTPYPYQGSALVMNSSLPALIHETYGTMRGVPAWMGRSLPDPFLSNEMQNFSRPPAPGTNSSLQQNLSPSYRNNGVDKSKSTQANSSQAPPTWCQSYINRPRSRAVPEGTTIDLGSSGKGANHDSDGKNANHSARLRKNTGDVDLGASQLMQTDAQQRHQQIQGGQPVLLPVFGTHTGVAQPQGAAAVVAGNARPRVRARRGQATDPHSIAERLRRERIAERMKALQELVPNANKTDKASMLDEIIDYVRFLQLQVKVLSMSRLGGAGAVAPLITDFPAEGQNGFAAATLSSRTAVHDGMVLAERQVVRLMEEDMGSAMQFLQAKGLCLMPVSLASVISSNKSRVVMGGGGQQGLSAIDQSRMHAASSTTSTLASAASSGCIGGEGESRSKQ